MQLSCLKKNDMMDQNGPLATFCGATQSKLTCSKCTHVTAKQETTLHLSLDIELHLSLDMENPTMSHRLETFFTPENAQDAFQRGGCSWTGKTKTPGSKGAAQVRAACMLLVHKYDLSTDVGRCQFIENQPTGSHPVAQHCRNQHGCQHLACGQVQGVPHQGHRQRCGLLEHRATGSQQGSQHAQRAFRQHVCLPSDMRGQRPWLV